MRHKSTFGDKLTADQRYYRRHKEKRNNDNKKYYQEHKKYWREFAYIRNKEKHRNCQKDWRRNNQKLLRLYSHKRRALLRDFNIKIAQQVYEDNIKKYGTLTCYLCLKSIEFGQDSLEHKIPLSRGGTNNYDNLEIAHYSCNLKKNTKTEKEYREYIKQ